PLPTKQRQDHSWRLSVACTACLNKRHSFRSQAPALSVCVCTRTTVEFDVEGPCRQANALMDPFFNKGYNADQVLNMHIALVDPLCSESTQKEGTNANNFSIACVGRECCRHDDPGRWRLSSPANDSHCWQ